MEHNTKTQSEKTVLYELMDKRDVNIKHFRMSDGTVRAEYFSEPVHYLDKESGEYRQIDNTLVEADGVLTNKAGAVKISFGKDELLKVTKDEYSVGWRMLGRCGKKRVRARKRAPEAENAGALLTNRVIYRDILPKTDLEYIINGQTVKENIILHSREAIGSFSFALNMENLTAKLSENKKEVCFCDISQPDKIVLRIPAPVMRDAAGAQSADVHYVLKTRAGVRYLTIKPDRAWLEDRSRVYPVAVDPVLMYDYNSYGFDTRRIYYMKDQNESLIECYSNGNSILQVGTEHTQYPGEYGPFSSLIRIPQISCAQDSAIVSAKMTMIKKQSFCEEPFECHIDVFYGRANWASLTNSSSIINSAINGGKVALLSSDMFQSSSDFVFDITKCVNDNTGSGDRFIAFMMEGPGRYDGYIEFDLNGKDGNPLQIQIDYELPFNKQSEVQHTVPVKSAGTGSVDLISGEHTFIHQDAALGGYGLPLDIAHVFRGSKRGDNAGVLSRWCTKEGELGLSEGWRLNLHQFLFALPETFVPSNQNELVPKYVYVDRYGYEHCLVRTRKPVYNSDGTINYENYEILDEDGLGLILNEATSTLTDKGGNKYKFTSCKLTQITDKYGNSMSISYAAGSYKISSVTDSLGRTAQFTYADNTGLLWTIAYADCTVGFRYAQGIDGKLNLTSIIESDGGQTKLAYVASPDSKLNKQISSITDKTGYRMKLTYDAQGRVTETKEATVAKHIAAGVRTDFTQSADGFTEKLGNYTLLRYAGCAAGVKTMDGIETVYVFNSAGMLVSSFENGGLSVNSIAGSKLAVSGKAEGRNYSAFESSVIKLEAGAPNMLSNGSFETGSQSWTLENTAAGDGITTESYTSGSQCLKLTGDMAAEKIAYQVLPLNQLRALADNSRLVFSGFGRAADQLVCGTYGCEANFRLRVKVKRGDEVKEYTSAFDLTKSCWQFAAVAVDLGDVSAIDEVAVHTDYWHNTGSAYFDNLTVIANKCSVMEARPALFDRGDGFKRYDMGQVANFRYRDSDHIPVFPQIETVTDYKAQTAALDILLMQAQVPSVSNPDLILYKDGKPYEDSTGTFTDAALIMKDGTVIRLFDAEIMPSSQTAFITPRGSAKMIKDYNGNITSSSVWGNNMEFKTEYQYNSNNDLVKETDYRGVVKTYSYSNNGAPVKSDIDSSDGKMDTSRVKYNAAHTYPAFGYDQRDTRDDDDKNIYTSYAYLQSKDILSYTISPDGTRVDYTFDASRRVTGLSCGVKLPGQSQADETAGLAYTYTRGLVTKIVGDGFTYELEYDGFGRVTLVKLNGAELEHSLYEDSTVYDVVSRVMAGDYTVKSTYDIKDRLISVKETDGDSAERTLLSYQYDDKNRVKKVIDRGRCYDNGADEPARQTAMQYTYNGYDEVTSIDYSGFRDGSVDFSRDKGGRLLGADYNLDNLSQSYSYGYETKTVNGKTDYLPDNRLKTVGLPDSKTVSYAYLADGRLSSKKVGISGALCREQYSYYTADASGYDFDVQGGAGTDPDPGTGGGTGSGTGTGGGSTGGTGSGTGGSSHGGSGGNFGTGSGTGTGKGTGTGRSAGANSAAAYMAVPRMLMASSAASAKTTNYVRTVDYSANGHYSQITYGYDKSGRIIHTAESAKDVMYRYDSLGRVVREDNEPLGFTFLYIYDINGNLDIVKRFKYTVSAPQTPLEAINYIYEAGRPDRLVKLVSSVNGELAIGSYDSAGNPRAFKGASLSWNKNGTLKTYVKGTQSLSFRYDASGIRQEKIVSGVSHNYTTFGSRILGEQYSGHNLSYYYDATGICGLRHNGLTSYYFQKNIQGDVIRILDTTGAVVARYDYDAWGNHKIYAKVNGNYIDITTNSLYNNHIARINPFRYRGYYFDVETGWYYLESRYYDPSLCRFISADDPAVAVSAQSGTFGGLNPYAYCLNDPVNMVDPTGHIGGWIIFGFIMAFIGLIFAIPAFVDSWHAFAKEPSWSNLGVALLATVDLVLAIIDFTQAFKAVYSAVKASKLLSAQIANPDVYKVKVGKSAGADSVESSLSFASEEKLMAHYNKHGGEFKGIFNSKDEYLQGARDVIKNGYKVEYSYKGDIRTGFVEFMGNNSKGNAKFAFVGTNNDGFITTFHTESGKTFWKMLNGENVQIINPI